MNYKKGKKYENTSPLLLTEEDTGFADAKPRSSPNLDLTPSRRGDHPICLPSDSPDRENGETAPRCPATRRPGGAHLERSLNNEHR